jgi:hypothetical protein
LSEDMSEIYRKLINRVYSPNAIEAIPTSKLQ